MLRTLAPESCTEVGIQRIVVVRTHVLDWHFEVILPEPQLIRELSLSNLMCLQSMVSCVALRFSTRSDIYLGSDNYGPVDVRQRKRQIGHKERVEAIIHICLQTC
jgi:hypothetical protein